MHAKFLRKIALRMRRWPEVRNLASQKFRLTPVANSYPAGYPAGKPDSDHLW